MGHRRKRPASARPRPAPTTPPGRESCFWVGHRASDPARRAPQDILFLGDFNADCKYVREQDWPAIRLRSSEVFKWLIPDSADTTVGNSDCAYDRIVVCGSRLRKSLKHQSATVHDFQEEFGLDQTQASAGAGAGPRARAVLDRDPNLRVPGTCLALAFLEKALRGSGLAGWNKPAVAVQEALSSLEWGPETVLPAHPQATAGVDANTSPPRCSSLFGHPVGPFLGGGQFSRVVLVGLAAQQGLRLGPFSLQALAISDHFPVEVTLKSH